jgi:hypothetical protein
MGAAIAGATVNLQAIKNLSAGAFGMPTFGTKGLTGNINTTQRLRSFVASAKRIMDMISDLQFGGMFEGQGGRALARAVGRGGLVTAQAQLGAQAASGAMQAFGAMKAKMGSLGSDDIGVSGWGWWSPDGGGKKGGKESAYGGGDDSISALTDAWMQEMVKSGAWNTGKGKPPSGPGTSVRSLYDWFMGRGEYAGMASGGLIGRDVSGMGGRGGFSEILPAMAGGSAPPPRMMPLDSYSGGGGGGGFSETQINVAVGGINAPGATTRQQAAQQARVLASAIARESARSRGYYGRTRAN